MFYNIRIKSADGSTVAEGAGDLADVAYLAKSGLKRIKGVNGDFDVTLDRTEYLAGPSVSPAVGLSLTADAETVTLVLTRKLAALRKAEKEQAERDDAENAASETEAQNAQDSIEALERFAGSGEDSAY
jgi:hypothetical protein